MATGFSEQAQTYRIGFISSRVYTILDRIENHRELRSKDREAILEGAALMSQIVSGSLLVENKGSHDGLSPSTEGIAVLGNALSVLRMLGSTIKKGGLSELFIHFHHCLDSISQGKSADDCDISNLKLFFEGLSKLILDDMKSEKLNNSNRLLSFKRHDGFSHSYAI